MSKQEKSVSMTESMSFGVTMHKVLRHIICIFLCCLSLFPFIVMIVNATRSSVAIQNKFTLIPSTYFFSNFTKLLAQCAKTVPIWRYMLNSAIIAGLATALSVYFSTLTAYGVTVYNFKLKKIAWAFIMAILMIPTQVSIVGFFKFMYQLGFGNSYVPLIVPAIAAPSVVFFMKQYMESALPLEIIDAARIDGSGEFKTFNHIALPLMKPAVATQAIFAFILSWNNLFTPSMLLTSQRKYTLPMFIQQMRGERFRTDYGIIYVGLVITILPIFIVYFTLSRYIIAGVALGGVKE
ncbi:carbohydrate ABC transporter permease [[Clostridium] polysaccharolyticum]|uniref:Multiple sugar transport system permease protein n=1 Tax=[Clostridium] polysaccharolyticum TaxID=29364 RepID=A0A1I0BUQ6_9FIRM|nr:carbohydrate ABC transporter permease [[Clostridium] polysaccharolyticum]SET10651.1 multiple sugar transport system permease protein [[Clostridium] polysaccharolyticum]